MNSTGDGRKVGQLRNDVDDIFDVLGGINTTLADHTTTLADHTTTLAQHTATLAEHTELHAEHTARFDGLDVKLDRVLEILDAR